MNFKEYKASLVFRKYNNSKIIIRFIEYKIKDVFIDFIINFNFLKFSSKPLINLGSFHDNRYINFLLYALKNDYLFAYKKDESTKKLFKRIGFSNFFKFWKKLIITFFNKIADLSQQYLDKMLKLLLKNLINFMAERMGFEPMKRLLLYTLSKRAPSTTRPSLL